MSKPSKRKQVKDIDLTQGGLFPKGWEGVGVKRNSKKESKKTRANRTPGHQKGENCKASYFARYCAKYARARKHRNYKTQLEAWGKSKC